MRISKAGLLVIAAFVVPVVVELRTALTWVGIELSVLESVALGAVIVLAIVIWAVWSPDADAEAGATDSG